MKKRLNDNDMKSSRFIFIFGAISLLLHTSLFLIRLEPQEPELIKPVNQRLIPIDLAVNHKPDEPRQPASETVANPEPPPAAKPLDPPAPPAEPIPLPDMTAEPPSETSSEPSPELPPETAEKPVQPPVQPQDTESGSTEGSAAVNSDSTDSERAAGINPFEGLLGRIDQNKKSTYPLSARKKGYQGTVYIKLVLDTDGNLVSSEIITKSSHSSLNAAALKLIDKIMETPYPHNLGRSVSLKIPITYKLD